MEQVGNREGDEEMNYATIVRFETQTSTEEAIANGAILCPAMIDAIIPQPT